MPLFLALCLNPCCTIKHVRHLVLQADPDPAPLPTPPAPTPLTQLPIVFHKCHSLSHLCCFPSVICSACKPLLLFSIWQIPVISAGPGTFPLLCDVFSYPCLRGTCCSEATSDTPSRSLRLQLFTYTSVSWLPLASPPSGIWF